MLQQVSDLEATMWESISKLEKALKAVCEELKEEKGLHIELLDKTTMLEQSRTNPSLHSSPPS